MRDVFRVVHHRLSISILLASILVVANGCSIRTYHPEDRFELPDGNSTTGRAVFVKMSCYSCHAVQGDTHPEPVAQPTVPVVLGPEYAKWSNERLALSIVDPSHNVPKEFRYSPDIRLGTLSRMGNYRDVMTVQELVDIVAYLRSLR